MNSLALAGTRALPILLEPYLNWKGITWKQKGIAGQLDPRASSIPGEVFPNDTWIHIRGVPFRIPKTDSERDDMISCEGQQIDFAGTTSVRSILLLGFSVFGDYSDAATLVYEDGTTAQQSLALTDWFQYTSDKTGLFGESAAIEIPYFLDGEEKAERPTAVWLQHIPANPASGLKRLRLPDNPFMFILALTLIES